MLLDPLLDEGQKVGFGGEQPEARMPAQQTAQEFRARPGHAHDEQRAFPYGRSARDAGFCESGMLLQCHGNCLVTAE
jgi:hypothetical protein